MKSVSFAELHHLFPCFIYSEETELIWLNAQNNVLQYRKALNQLKVLMYHAYPERSCVVRIVNGNRLPVHSDLTLFGVVQSEQHAHKRTLAGSVLTQKCMDLALA